jgi:hypothetical protein
MSASSADIFWTKISLFFHHVHTTLYNVLYHAFSSFLLSTAVQYLMISREVGMLSSFQVATLRQLFAKFGFENSSFRLDKLPFYLCILLYVVGLPPDTLSGHRDRFLSMYKSTFQTVWTFFSVPRILAL